MAYDCKVYDKNGSLKKIVRSSKKFSGLTKNFLNQKVFNQFYLFKSSKKLSKLTEYKEFNGFNALKKNYKNKLKINSNFGKDKITLYKN